MNAEDIIKATKGVTSKWAKQRKAEERQANRVFNRRYVMTRSYRTTIKEVADEVMEDAYMKASSGGKYPAHARQIMYAARPQILAKADCTSLNDAYFTQTLLPDYMRDNPNLTAAWDVVFDARGHLHEPHTDKEVALGTLSVRQYLNRIAAHHVDGFHPTLSSAETYPTVGPTNRFGGILFIEKEGFLPLLKAAKIGERYDLAIMSTKGMSTTAARQLVDELCGNSVPLYVLHDFDKAGFSIAATLQRDTRRYEFNNIVNVIDLGLRLEDVEKYDLQSEPVRYGKTDPTCNLRENGATDEEVTFLCTGDYERYRGGYHGRRVELNAFSSGDFVKWIESKLKRHDVKKVVSGRKTLEKAYRRAALAAILIDKLDTLLEEAEEEVDAAKIPALTRTVKALLKKRPGISWDQAIENIASNRETS